MRKGMLLLLVLCIPVLCKAEGGDKFYAQEYRDIWTELQNRSPFSVNSDTLIYLDGVVEGVKVPIRITQDKYGIIDHIGLCLMTGSSSQEYYPALCAAERIFLRMCLTEDFQDLALRYSSKNLNLYVDNESLMPSPCAFPAEQVYDWVRDVRSLDIVYREEVYYIEMENTSHRVSLDFKADTYSLYGMTKREADMQLAYQLMSSGPDSLESTRLNTFLSGNSRVEHLNDSLYVKRGQMYNTPKINNDIVYRRADSVYTSVFDRTLPAISLSNVMLGAVDMDLNIHIRHNAYSGFIDYDMTNRAFDGYFADRYVKYFGISFQDDEKVEGILLLEDMCANVVHMGVVTATIENFFQNHEVDMELLSNMPKVSTIIRR